MMFPDYEEVDESKMDRPEAQTSKKVNKGNFEAPPLPCRSKSKQQTKRNRSPISTTITSDPNDGAASDTDSGYEHVTNPPKKHNRSSQYNLTDGQGEKQSENHGNGRHYKSQPNKSINVDKAKLLVDSSGCGKWCKSDSNLLDKRINNSPTYQNVMQDVTRTVLIKEDRQHTRKVTSARFHEICNMSSEDEGNIGEAKVGLAGTKDHKNCDQELFKCMAPSKALADDNIRYKGISRQDIRRSHKTNKYRDGYQKLIKETMEPVSCKYEYQKLNKLTVEPHLDVRVTPKTEPLPSQVRHHTLWAEEDDGGIHEYVSTRRPEEETHWRARMAIWEKCIKHILCYSYAGLL